jgi:hypothetical protein
MNLFRKKNIATRPVYIVTSVCCWPIQAYTRLRHSIKLRTSTPGELAERACGEELLNAGIVLFLETRPLESVPRHKYARVVNDKQ